MSIRTEQQRVDDITLKFKQLQEQELSNRLRRLLELNKIREVLVDPSAIHFQSSDSIEPFVKEAADAHICGMYRSCIFVCATAVHHIFLSVLIRRANFRLRTAKTLQRAELGTTIRKMRSVRRYEKIAQKAEWLKDARNKIAAHPFYVKRRSGTTPIERDFENVSMARSALNLLELLEPSQREQIEKSTIIAEGKTLTYKESLTNRDWIRSEIIWVMLETYVMPLLAFKAYKILYDAMREFGIYVTTIYHTRAPYETEL